MIEPNTMRIVTHPAKRISDGLCVSNDAYLQIDDRVSSKFTRELVEYMEHGWITVHTARLKPAIRGRYD